MSSGGHSNKNNISCQTDEVKMSEGSTQKPLQVHSPAQTTLSMFDQSTSSIDFSMSKGLSKSRDKEISVDYHRLHRFLHRSVPLIELEIRDSCQFDQLSSSWINYWNGASGNLGLHCERRLSSKILDDLSGEVKSSSFGPNQIISGITWNAPQTTLAVVYRVPKHNDWCTHKTFLLLWNLFSRKNDSHSLRPMYACEVDNCVTHLIAHPFKGSLYALGCYNGSLIVIDTRLLDSSSSSTDFLVDLPVSHRSLNRGDLHIDSIIGLHWLKCKRTSIETDEDHLMSFSSDGMMIRWKMEPSGKSKLLEPLELFNIILSDLPKSMGLKDTLGHFYKGVPILLTTWELDNENGFIVGCEAGAIFRCSLNGNVRNESIDAPVRPSDWLPIKNPIVMSYVPHRAGVTNVNFSPNLRNLFISTGADNEFRVWDVFQSKPLFVVHCDVNIVSTVWLSARPVIFTVQDDGFICVFTQSSENVIPDQH